MAMKIHSHGFSSSHASCIITFFKIYPDSLMLLPSAPELDSVDTSKAIYSARSTGSSDALVITDIALKYQGLIIVVVADTPEAHRLEQEISFFSENQFSILNLPDWETLPYDMFSPHLR